jgi:hypothetical protein
MTMGIRVLGRRPSAGRTLSRRAVVGALATALTLAACGGNDPNASSTTTGGSTGTTDAPVLTNAPTTTNPELVPVSGGSIVVGLEAESPGFNPHVDPWSNAGHNVAKAHLRLAGHLRRRRQGGSLPRRVDRAQRRRHGVDDRRAFGHLVPQRRATRRRGRSTQPADREGKTAPSTARSSRS